MRMRLILLPILILILGLLASCGGSSTPANQANDGNGIVAGGPTNADAEIAADNARSVSNTFTRYFQDAVNLDSRPRWTVTDNYGHTHWDLFNTANSPPKSWVLGGNYWNQEDDQLTSNLFTIPAAPSPFFGGQPDVIRKGIILNFYSRWSIASGDSCAVEYNYDSAGWNALTTLTNGQNASYPGWTKYSFAMPDMPDNLSTDVQIRYNFHSNTSGNDWGCGIDDVSVFQTNINAPTGVTAGNNPGGVFLHINWTAPPATDHLLPYLANLYRAPDVGGAPGTFAQVVNGLNAANGATGYDDQGLSPGTTYWYLMTYIKDGWNESAQSTADSGST